MNGLSRRSMFISCVGCALCAVIVLLFAPSSFAAPVRYTGFTITDGKLGTWEFHNARVYLTFQSDTKYVEFVQVPFVPDDPNCQLPNNPPPCTVDVNLNTTGKAGVTIVSGDIVVHANFAPHQVFVSFDLGDTPADNIGRGVGFGSYSATAPGGLEVAYPLGIEDGTLHRVDILQVNPSPELAAMPVDLKQNSVFSGRAWICVNFPFECLDPNALKTDRGDLYLYLPYFMGSGSPAIGSETDSLSTATFIVETGEFDDEGGSGVVIPRERTSSGFKHPISYHGYVTADASLGGKLYTGAQVYLSFDADVSTAVPYVGGPPNSFINAVGDAHVTIVSGGRAVSADFDRGQIYVYYDVGNASIGFGSVAGKSGYPLSITAKREQSDVPHILDGQSLVQAVSDIALNNDPGAYSPETASLVTDLTNETTMSGPAYSCIAFDPTTSFCQDLTAIPLATNRGPFRLFESYTVDQNGDGTGIYSPNWGVFWSELGRPRRNN